MMTLIIQFIGAMRIVHYCKATYVQRTLKKSEIVFGKGDHSLRMQVKTSLNHFDRLLARFNDTQWRTFTYRDKATNKRREVYVRISQLSAILGVNAARLSKADLHLKFREVRNRTKERWKLLGPRLTAIINASQFKEVDPQEMNTLCQYIEAHKYEWIKSVCMSGLRVQKLPKTPQKFTIYLLRPDESNEIKILINLGSKYKYNVPNLFRAIDYDQMKIRPFLKKNTKSHPGEYPFSVELQAESITRTYALLTEAQVTERLMEVGTAQSEKLQKVVIELDSNLTHDTQSFVALCQKIEQNRARWLSQLRQSERTLLKIGKSPIQKYSIYVVKKYNSTKAKIIINLGKTHIIGKGAFKIVTQAIDYDKMKVGAFAKMKPSHCAKDAAVKECLRHCENELSVLRTLPKSYALVGSKYNGFLRTIPFPKYYIFMDYCEVGDLHSSIDLLSIDDIPQVMEDLFDGLEIIHAEGRAHQDLKTENILLYKDKRTKKIRAKISDFGFCVAEDEADTWTGNILYSSPFKLRGENHPKAADVWALGMIFYNIMYGELIYDSIADKAWNIDKNRLHVADAFEEKYYQDLPYATSKLNRLIFGMMTPVPEAALTLDQAKAAFYKLREADFLIDDQTFDSY